jgi:peptidoglycan/xylan/chitin deacetylase (PgdA/CDA1 family)
VIRALVLAAGLWALIAAAPVPIGVPILMYHKVDAVAPADAVGRSLTISPAAFEAQLAWLRAHGIRTLTTEELADALAHGRRPASAVVLTFDDGYLDAATVVLPLLVKYGARASFYVTSGFVGDRRHASWAQLRAMRAAGMEIGCHGTRHRDLSQMTQAEVTYEIRHCVDTLARYLARPTTYAYAAGKWSAGTFAVLREAGLKAALTERPGVALSLDLPYVWPRRRIDSRDGLGTFGALATP